MAYLGFQINAINTPFSQITEFGKVQTSNDYQYIDIPAYNTAWVQVQMTVDNAPVDVTIGTDSVSASLVPISRLMSANTSAELWCLIQGVPPNVSLADGAHNVRIQYKSNTLNNSGILYGRVVHHGARRV